MKLEVMSISFLRSGALSVEVSAQSQKDAPAEPSLDVAAELRTLLDARILVD